MNIKFILLSESHFPLLLKWLEAPHVKIWWDKEVNWTPELIREKYASYAKGYKLENGVAKAISAYIISVDDTPIGYIQMYNAYDFSRSKLLRGLPSSLAALDIFIGEEQYLKQGIASKAIVRFLHEYSNAYTHVLADPENTNLAAVRAYEKAGFKKNDKQPGTGKIWMIRQQNQRPGPLHTIKKVIQERYSDAKAIFWSGSVSKNEGKEHSDLDLVIIYDKVPNAYREAFIYEGWPIDAFIHDPDTLRYFFEESKNSSGISGLIHMVLEGQVITPPTRISESVIKMAKDYLEAGPAVWDKSQIDKERFLITDVLDDIKSPVSQAEQMASAGWLYEALSQFYFRSQNKWCASGKSIVRYLKSENPTLESEFTYSFSRLFKTGDSSALEILVKKILGPFGGLLWDGFKSNAASKCKIPDPSEKKESDT